MSWRILFLTISIGLGGESVSRATSIAPPSLPALVGGSEAVVVGEVVEIEPDRIELDVPLFKRRANDGKVKFAVAKFRPTECLLGVPAGDTIRVAFVPEDQQPNDGLGIPTPVLKVGEKRLLYLDRDKGKNLLVANSPFSNGTGEADAETEAKLTRRICKLLEKPWDSLQAKAEEDRMYTAWALAARYQRPFHTGENKLEEIPARESRAILEGLALIPDNQARHLCGVASGLGNLTGAFDVRTNTAEGFNTAGVRKWLLDHRDTLRLKRYVGRETPAEKRGQ